MCQFCSCADCIQCTLGVQLDPNNAFDLDTDSDNADGAVIPTIDCQYYSIDYFFAAKFSPSKTFSVLHYNIHSIQCHIEEFRVALKMLDFTFDIICISEMLILKLIL